MSYVGLNLKGSDEDELRLVLLASWTLTIVWYSEHNVLWHLDLLLSSGEGYLLSRTRDQTSFSNLCLYCVTHSLQLNVILPQATTDLFHHSSFLTCDAKQSVLLASSKANDKMNDAFKHKLCLMNIIRNRILYKTRPEVKCFYLILYICTKWKAMWTSLTPFTLPSWL
jgi:hypothetical protein